VSVSLQPLCLRQSPRRAHAPAQNSRSLPAVWPNLDTLAHRSGCSRTQRCRAGPTARRC
jgi:hypothetical protein